MDWSPETHTQTEYKLCQGAKGKASIVIAASKECPAEQNNHEVVCRLYCIRNNSRS